MARFESFFFFSSRRRHTRYWRDWSSDVCSSDLFVTTLYGAAEMSVVKGRTLKDTFAATREAMDKKFGSFAIYEHCLPFNVARAFDEASGIDDPVIWTAERDRQMWEALQA